MTTIQRCLRVEAPPAQPSAPPAGRSDEALLSMYLDGKRQDAFAELVARYQHSAYRVAFAHCGSSQLAEESVQNTFVKLASGKVRPRYLEPGGFRNWFLSVVSNEACNASRSERRSSRRLEHPRFKEKIKRMETSRARPGERMDDEVRSLLLKELESLDESQRTPLILHFMEGFTQEKVGEMLGLRQSAIARRIAVGLKTLRVRLAQSGLSAVPALPLALSDSSLIQAPASLQRVLGNPDLQTQSAARGLAGHTIRSKAAAGLLPKAALLSTLAIAAAGTALWFGTSSPSPQPKSSPESEHPTPEPQTPPLPAATTASEGEPAHRAWSFEQAPDAAAFPVHYGKVRWSKDGGLKNSGCLETEGAPALFEVKQPLPQLPMRVTFRLRPVILAQEDAEQVHTIFVRWCFRNETADFQHVGTAPHIDLRDPERWMTFDAVLTRETVALYADGVLVDLRVCTPKPGTGLHLTLWGRYRLDDLTLDAPASRATPEVAPLLEALKRIPLRERSGTKTLVDFPQLVPGRHVGVVFPPAAKP